MKRLTITLLTLLVCSGARADEVKVFCSAYAVSIHKTAEGRQTYYSKRNNKTEFILTWKKDNASSTEKASGEVIYEELPPEFPNTHKSILKGKNLGPGNGYTFIELEENFLTLNHFNKCPMISENCRRNLYITVSRVSGKFFLKEERLGDPFVYSQVDEYSGTCAPFETSNRKF